VTESYLAATFTTAISDILICNTGVMTLTGEIRVVGEKTCPCSTKNPRELAGFLVNENLPETKCDV